LVAFLKTRNQKRKQEDDILIPDTPVKKTKTPAKRGLKKNTKEPVIEALNDGDNGKIQKPAPVVKRDRKKKEPIIEALNDTPINQKENNEVRSDDEYIDGNDSKDDDGVIDYDDIEDDDDNE
ncbi:9724_t:CDS:2, partial [Funneliformis geosporum]